MKQAPGGEGVTAAPPHLKPALRIDYLVGPLAFLTRCAAVDSCRVRFCIPASHCSVASRFALDSLRDSDSLSRSCLRGGLTRRAGRP